MNTSPHGSGDLFPWEQEETPPLPSEPETIRTTAEAQSEQSHEYEETREAEGAEEEFDLTPPRPVAPREYYSISEVCDLVDLKPHVLRYWETQFPVLNPSKNRSGNRVYQRKEIRLILLVKHLLYDEKYTVEGARAKLEQLRRGGTLHESTRQALEPQMIELLRGELHQLLRILSPQAAGSA